MKILNTVIVTSVLALGLAGNSMAAPSQVQLLKIQQQTAQANKQAAQQRAAQIQRQAAQQKVVQARQQAIKAQQLQAAKQKAAQAQQQAAKKRVVVQKVPSKQVAQSNYRVATGDTLYRIAQRNNVSVETLVKLNGLWGSKASNLSIGAIIRLK
ncbi:LysM peptidoglycan-binding domain-containing protein [Leucothrix arctica]|uniref:LysM domain-containing protein n=1 Tax=Leucothrix arctica TaxID=1481894 RepID=A0A317CGQ0_9GAMM|nr:LysM domain-containing protein [Leucothrix arctica]PWQ97567.1 hypothetical protein DKT75_06515 [Leucothrix arctica]